MKPAGRPYHVLIVGALAGNDLMFAEHLARRGLRCCVARKPPAAGRADPMAGWNEYHTHVSPEDVRFFRNGAEFVRIARDCHAIVSFTGSFILALKWLWPLRRWMGLPPVINVCTGSDIMELALEQSRMGWLYRQHLGSADLNWCFSSPEALRNMVALRIPNAVFMRYPFYLAPQAAEREPRSEGRLRLFHASHLDWKVNDPGEHRRSAKGNDRFLRALARAVRDGLDAECVILDRGPDRAEARKLAEELGIADRLMWKPQLSRDELFAEFANADVVVDQFDVGCLGGIAAEAMSLARPVMVYVNAGAASVIYPERVPVLSCRSEDEIHAQLMACSDRERLRKLGAQARAWIRKYHSWETCLEQFLFYYTLLTGDRVANYGWDLDH